MAVYSAPVCQTASAPGDLPSEVFVEIGLIVFTKPELWSKIQTEVNLSAQSSVVKEEAFMGLFDKKYCDICGKKIGLLGNKKLEDANMCKECAAKLSPWFSERRHSSLEEIKSQLAYREDNRAAVAAFHTTRSLGRYTKVLLDEDARKFMITSARDLAEANPDVLDYSQVTGCDLDINESRSELRHADSEGKQVSYDPPRYEYSYSFYVTVHVNHPFFDEMRFALNSGSVRTGERQMNVVPGWKLNISGLLGNAGVTEYNEYLALGNEIKETFLQMHEGVRAEAEAKSAPKTAVVCPLCGATTFPDENNCCEYCGGALG